VIRYSLVGVITKIRTDQIRVVSITYHHFTSSLIFDYITIFSKAFS